MFYVCKVSFSSSLVHLTSWSCKITYVAQVTIKSIICYSIAMSHWRKTKRSRWGKRLRKGQSRCHWILHVLTVFLGVFFNLPNLQFPPKLWSASTSNQLPTAGNKILLCGETSAFSPEQRVSTARRQVALKHVGKTKKISQTRAGPCHLLHFGGRCPNYWRQELKGCCQWKKKQH